MAVISDRLTDGAKLGRGAQIRFTVRAIRDSAAHDAILVQSRTVVDVDAATGAFTTPSMDPGPYVCEIRWGAAQPFEKFEIVVPESSSTLRLWPLIDDLIPYEPPVVSLVKQYLEDTKEARDETESFAAIAGAAAAVAVEQAEGGPIELAMAVSAAEFGVPGTDVWYSIPGLDVTVTTGDRPAYASVDFGIVVADGVTRPVTSLSPRIWDDTAGVSLATGYIQALNPLPNSDPQYLLTQPPSLGVRLPAGWTNHRLLVQVQIPGDQAGPSWQFNTNWIPTQSSIRVVAT